MGLFKTYSEKEVKRVGPLVKKINELEPDMQKLSDNELRGKTDEFKNRLDKGETLDDLLPEAFAVVREAAKRVLGMRHFDVQLIGGIILHQGRIAEMKTGEGKTLVATLPVYLNALTGKGVHVITVNDYLAKRDSEWMGKVYKFLGLTVGLSIAGMNPQEKQKAYACDVTYGTNNEFGFDYLRDNMVIYKDQLVQRGLNYAIVDEIDSILIDEARTPLIISGRGTQSSDLYKKADRFVRKLTPKWIQGYSDITGLGFLWNEYLDALIINGDCVFVEDKGNEFIGWGTPWCGSSPYCENRSVPVLGLVVLKQGNENSIRKLDGFEKVSEVSNNIIYPMWLENGMDLCLDTLDHLLRNVPVYELTNKADKESVELVKQVIFIDEKN